MRYGMSHRCYGCIFVTEAAYLAILSSISQEILAQHTVRTSRRDNRLPTYIICLHMVSTAEPR